jgi:hypothetical protein
MTDRIPQEWLSDGDAWEIEGSDIVDKAQLVGVAFLVTAVSFRKGARGVEYLYADVTLADGTQKTFTDSSTGVKTQVQEMWLSKNGEEPKYSTEEVWHSVRIVARQGLRVSVYRREGSKEDSRTYYLTASGVRPVEGRSEAAEPVASAKGRAARSR